MVLPAAELSYTTPLPLHLSFDAKFSLLVVHFVCGFGQLVWSPELINLSLR
jgi:hypothetical protein